MKMNSNQLFSLRWNNYLGHMTGAFESLRSGEDFVDVTLSCEGKKIKAHKMLLSACSSYFKEIFKDNPCQHPVIVFRNVRYNDLVALVNFIYQGEVNVVQEQLSSFLATAELLAVKGLTDCNDNTDKIKDEEWEFEEEVTPTVSINNTDSPIALTRLNKGSDYRTHSFNKKRTTVSEEKFNESSSDVDQNRVRGKKGKLPPSSILSSTDNRERSIEIIPMIQSKELTDEADSYREQNTMVTFNENESVRFHERCSEMTDRPNFFPRTLPADDKSEVASATPSISDDVSANRELLRQLMQKPLHESESTEDSIQGHWLSSLNNNSNNNNNESSVETDQNHRHMCNICGATYKHLRNLRAHCHLHYGKTKCNLCDKVLCNISYFKKHLQQQHGLLMDYNSRRSSSTLAIRKKESTINE